MPPIIGVDYGERRVGLAISDPSGTMAVVLRVAHVSSDDEAVQEIRRAYDENEAGQVLLGLPLTLRGERGPMALKVEAFGKALEAAGMAVVFWDERLSTAAVERALIAADMNRRDRKGVRDKLAAQITLQSYLDSRICHDDPAQAGEDE